MEPIMNKFLFAAVFLVLFINKSLGDSSGGDSLEDRDDGENSHRIVKRSGYGYFDKGFSGNAGFHGGVGQPGFLQGGGPVQAGFPGGAFGNAGFTGGNRFPSRNTRPNYFTVPTRYRGYTTDYYYPQFQYAFVPAGYAYNYYEVPIYGTFGSKGGYGGKAINVNVRGSRGYHGPGGKFW